MKKIILFSIIIILNSCYNLIAKKIGLTDLEPQLTKLKVPHKDVYFLGIMHLGKKEYYDNVKIKITNFQNEGYTFYVEGASSFENGKKTIDTISLKKMRKITGLDFSIKYSQMTNDIFKKMVEKIQLQDQPNYEDLGAINIIKVDYNFKQLISFFETENTIVKLDSCDLATPLGIEFKCSQLNKETRDKFDKEILLEKRNKQLADSILNSKHKKIVVVYGKKHLDGVQKLILNNNFPSGGYPYPPLY